MRMKLSERVTRWMADKVIEQIVAGVQQEATQAPQEPEETGETTQSVPAPTWAPCDLYRVRILPYEHTWVGSREAFERSGLTLSANEKVEQRWVAYDWRSVETPTMAPEPEQETEALWDELRKHYTEPVLTEALTLAEQATSAQDEVLPKVEAAKSQRPKRGASPKILTPERIAQIRAADGEWVDLGRWSRGGWQSVIRNVEFEFKKSDIGRGEGTNPRVEYQNILARTRSDALPVTARSRALTPARAHWLRENPNVWTYLGRFDYSTLTRTRKRVAPYGYEVVGHNHIRPTDRQQTGSVEMYARYTAAAVSLKRGTAVVETPPTLGTRVALSKAG